MVTVPSTPCPACGSTYVDRRLPDVVVVRSEQQAHDEEWVCLACGHRWTANRDDQAGVEVAE
jgi:transposase